LVVGVLQPAEAVHEDLPVPAPPTRKMTQKEMETKLGLELSKNLWKKLVPGYQIGSHSTQSRFHEDFKYDPSELEPVVKTHCRRRDEFTNYVEAAARYKQMMGKKG